MATVKMKKLSLFILREQKDDLLRELMLLGCVEISAPDAILSEPEAPGLVRQEPGGLEARLADYHTLGKGLEIISRRFPEKRGRSKRLPKITQKALLDEKELPEYLDMAKAILTLDAKSRLLSDEEAREQGFIESLEPWKSLNLPLNGETEQASVIIGTVPSSANIKALEKALSSAVFEASLSPASKSRDKHYIAIVCLRDRREDVLAALRPFSFYVSPLKNIAGTASENIESASARISEMQNARAQILTQIGEHAKQTDALRRCYDLVGTQVARAEASEKLLATSSSFYLTGWAAAPSEAALSGVFSKYICAWELKDPSQEELEAAPVTVKRRAPARLFDPLRINAKYVDVIRG